MLVNWLCVRSPIPVICVWRFPICVWTSIVTKLTVAIVVPTADKIRGRKLFSVWFVGKELAMSFE